MLELLKEIKESLENDNLMIALNSAITLPDICGQVEFPEEKNTGKRYRDWCDSYLYCAGFLPTYKVDPAIPRDQWQKERIIDSKTCYQLRCALLHSHNSDLNKNQKEEFPQFKLIRTTAIDTGAYSIIYWNDHNKNKKEEWVDIRILSQVLCNSALEYYNKIGDAEKFKVHHIEIMDFESKQNQIHSKRPEFSYQDLSDEAKTLFHKISRYGFKAAKINLDDDEVQKSISELIAANLFSFPNSIF